MKVRFKKLVPIAETPRKAHPSDAGFDLTATSRSWDGSCWVYGTGLAVEVPEGYAGFVFPRSSVAKRSLELSNCVGIIDAHYRGEVTFKFRPVFSRETYLYEVGERIGQLVILPLPQIDFEESEELSDTDRGTGGYGSSGN